MDKDLLKRYRSLDKEKKKLVDLLITELQYLLEETTQAHDARQRARR